MNNPARSGVENQERTNESFSSENSRAWRDLVQLRARSGLITTSAARHNPNNVIQGDPASSNQLSYSLIYPNQATGKEL